jgi:hypothetical protein
LISDHARGGKSETPPRAFAKDGTMSWTRFQEILLPNGTLLLAPLSQSQGLRLSPPETQSVAITGTPTGGTFTLQFGTQVTAGIAYNATAAAVATALQALSGIGSTGCNCTVGPLPGSSVTVQFLGALGGPQGLLLGNGANLTGGSSPAVTITRLSVGAFEVPPANGSAGAGPAAIAIRNEQIGFGLMTSAQLGNPGTLSAMAIAYHAATGTAPATGTLIDVFV